MSGFLNDMVCPDTNSSDAAMCFLMLPPFRPVGSGMAWYEFGASSWLKADMLSVALSAASPVGFVPAGVPSAMSSCSVGWGGGGVDRLVEMAYRSVVSWFSGCQSSEVRDHRITCKLHSNGSVRRRSVDLYNVVDGIDVYTLRSMRCFMGGVMPTCCFRCVGGVIKIALVGYILLTTSSNIHGRFTVYRRNQNGQRKIW